MTTNNSAEEEKEQPTHMCMCGFEGDFITVMSHGVSGAHMFGPIEKIKAMLQQHEPQPHHNID